MHVIDRTEGAGEAGDQVGLAVDLFVRTGEQHAVAALLGAQLDVLHEVGEEGIAQVWDDDAEGAVGAAPQTLGGHVGLEAQLGDDLIDDALLGLGDRWMSIDDPRDRADGHAGLPGNVADCRARFHIDLGVRFRRLCITVPQVISMRLLPGSLDASGGSRSPMGE